MPAWKLRNTVLLSVYRLAAAATFTCAGIFVASCASTGTLGPLDLSDQEVQQRIRMHRGDWWTFRDDPPNPDTRSEDIKFLHATYFIGKQISLNEGFIKTRNEPFQVQLHLVNTGLMCTPIGGMSNFISPCRQDAPQNVQSDGDPFLAKCLEKLGGRRTNLLGAFTAKTTVAGQEATRLYCLHVIVLELKERVVVDGVVHWRTSPTRTETDQLKIAILDENGFGDSGPGTIVGGPRQQFSRAPQN